MKNDYIYLNIPIELDKLEEYEEAGYEIEMEVDSEGIEEYFVKVKINESFCSLCDW